MKPQPHWSLPFMLGLTVGVLALSVGAVLIDWLRAIRCLP